MFNLLVADNRLKYTKLKDKFFFYKIFFNFYFHFSVFFFRKRKEIKSERNYNEMLLVFFCITSS